MLRLSEGTASAGTMTARKGPKPRPLADRFWARVKKSEDSCWLWTGARSSNGYGKIGGANRSNDYTHRVAWTLAHGEIPEGLFVCHRCDVKLCVRPDHLFLGTLQDNHADMTNKGRNFSGEPCSAVNRGSRNNRAILTEAQATEIRELRASGAMTQRAVADRYGVSPSAVRFIERGETWRHVSPARPQTADA